MIVNTGSYTRTDGTTAGFVDAALTYFSAAGATPADFTKVAGGQPPATKLTDVSDTAALAARVAGADMGAIDPFQAADQLASALQTGTGDANDIFGSLAWRRENMIHEVESGPALAKLIVGEDDVTKAPPAPAQSGNVRMDQLAAAMVQGMVTFGVESAGDGLSHWKQDAPRPIDLAA